MGRFTFIDLFAGIGGFKMALSNNGGQCLGFSEISKDAIRAYCENHKISPDENLGDITQIKELPPHDILTAGVPCQSWSIAGKNLGFDDDRGQLWNDTIYLLHQSQPKAFIFENVKGLVDPRNQEALSYILDRIRQAGYHARHYVINSHDYGVAQNRVRIYIIGFREKKHFDAFKLPPPIKEKVALADVLGWELPENAQPQKHRQPPQKDLFGNAVPTRRMSLSSKNGFNDYFLFNDLRNGHTTIHSWDIMETTDRQKHICLLLLKNRRKSQFGPLDGNPLSLAQFQLLDSSITQGEIDELVDLGILKKVDYGFEVSVENHGELTPQEEAIISLAENKRFIFDRIKTNRSLKVQRIPISDTINSLLEKEVIDCTEIRYDFKNTKISSGLNGVNRVFMPSSDVFPTLVASDTNDYIALEHITPTTVKGYKEDFLKKIYFPGKFRKITKEEACQIQGFPKDFILPESRARWMKLLGNSVSVPVIGALAKAILRTGALESEAPTH